MNPGKSVYRLFPPPFEEVSLHGLYLNLNLHRLGTAGKPFVYANFLTSLDGRIALEDASGQTFLPKSLTTPDDFRLFLELEAQADCLITHGGYLRSLQERRLGNILQIGLDERSRDLSVWRKTQGLKPQPDIVVASASLDFPMPPSIHEHGQRCLIATGRHADPERVRHWEREGHEILFAGDGAMAEGDTLVDQLDALGYRSLYLIAGPRMLDTMVRNGRLCRLFQTITHQLLGGEGFRTLVPGPELGPHGHLKMQSLYYDPTSPLGTGQWFAQFENLTVAA
ncbi:RibD family protein [Methylococcus capsulatus]|jgi:riboflavin biosynthesis pyrimidine reductase|uniref:RibD C-terminal domain protein n=1 Tax=Methylococcus capsulatus TaxID=414 RepID=A0AA35XUI9_METCP|nr:dihydrofolate reductase family protein [Methylococcus capsulatus]CAI8864877.1 RibD C-terminal domain protein [Methylococcus capsulatus]